MAPNPPPAPEVNIASHSIEMMTVSRTVLAKDGSLAEIHLVGQHGVELTFPGFAYPFIKNGVEVLAIVSLVQVTKAEPASSLILPNKGLIVG